MPRKILIASVVAFALAAPNAQAQDLPPPDVLKKIIRQLDRKLPAKSSFQPAAGAQPDDSCGMRRASMLLTRGNDAPRSFPVLLDRGGNPSPKDILAVITRLTVDADGSPRSYHPDDPLGAGESCKAEGPNGNAMSGVCALDALSNAGVRVFRGAEPVMGNFSGAWKTIWPLIRGRKLKPVELKDVPAAADRADGYYLFHSRAHELTAIFKAPIFPFAADGYPCLHGEATGVAGYFVSATTFEHPALRKSPDRCAAARYLDSERIPFFVIPGGPLGQVSFGDIAIGRLKTKSGERLVFGIVGDQGPAKKFGEGSIAFNRALLGASRPLRNMRDVWALDIGPAWLREHGGTLSVLMLGGTRELLNGDFTKENIENVGRREFARWNGRNSDPAARLKACVAQAAGG